MLQIQRLAIGYHNQQGALVQVLRGIDLTVQRGETIGLVGESGSGKSTLALALMGYLRRGSRLLGGGVEFEGTAIFQQTAQQLTALRGNKIALIPQNAGQSLTPSMRIGKQVEEALLLHTDLQSQARLQRMQELFAQVRLPDATGLKGRYPHELSGGQQQRVAIAMALAGEPKLLVLDEPTTGLDVTTQAHILALLYDLVRTAQTAMIYVSHDLGVIAHVCERVAVMYAGEIVETGTCAEVLRQPKHPYTRGLLAVMPRVGQGVLPAGVPGAPPPIGSITIGCAFAARCAWGDGECLKVNPTLAQVANGTPGHQVRCHHLHRIESYRRPVAQPHGQAVVESSQDTTLLRLQDVEVTYHKTGPGARLLPGNGAPPATVSDISLQVHTGQTLALVGESGSGKSTILRAIAGLLTPQQGVIYFAGANLPPQVNARSADLHRRIQLVFQNPDASLNPRHSVLEILAQPLRLYWGLDSDPLRRRAVELLHWVRLGEQVLSRFSAQLSGGEKQRVAIARAFAAKPDLILCDEVTSSLDVSVQAAVLGLLRDLQAQQQATYIFVSHDLALVRTVADQVGVLYYGRLCEIGPVAAIYDPPFHPYTATLLNAVLEPEPGMTRQLTDPGVIEAAAPVCGCPFQRRCVHHRGMICDSETPPWQSNAIGGISEHKIRCHISWDELMEISNVL